MKKLDQNSGHPSFGDESEVVSSALSGATALFSRASIAQVSPNTSGDEIEALLRTTVRSDVAPAQAQAGLAPGEKREAPLENRGAAKAESPAPKADLTQIFRKVQLEPAVDAGDQASGLSVGENDARPVKTPDASSLRKAEDSGSGFTQLFQSLSATPAAEIPLQEDWSGDNFPVGGRLSNISQPLTSTSPAQGEFTRLFQRLDRQEPPSAYMEEKLNVPPAAPQLGGFTQLLRTLSAETEPDIPALHSVSAPLPTQPSSGPGEFTRIISGSMLREAQGHTARPEAGTFARPEAAPSMGAQASGGVAGPALLSSAGSMLPVMPMASPAIAPTPHQLVSSFPASAMIPVLPPQNIAPAAASELQAPATNKLQQYIPMLLIANLFLMLLVLILVSFAFLHR